MEHLTWRRKLAFSAVALGVFAVLLLGAGELAVRAIAPKSDGQKLGAPLEGSARLYGLRPNQRALHVGVPVQTNSLGFREKEYPVERRPGVKRIAVLGDSFTFGVGVPFNEVFSKRLEAALNGTEVINFGVPGYNTTNELATLREVAAKFQPDLVIVGYVLNDAELAMPEGAAGAKPKDQPRLVNRVHVAMKDISMLYRFVTPQLGALAGMFNARYAVGQTNNIIRSFADDAPGWVESRASLKAIHEESRRLGAPMLVVVFPMMVDFASYPLGAAHARVRQFCESQGIPVLDLLPSFAGRDASQLIVLLDGHPNARAHEIFAARILEHLRNGAKHDL